MIISVETSRLLSRALSVYAMSQTLSDFGDLGNQARALALIEDLRVAFPLGELKEDERPDKSEFVPYYSADYVQVLISSIQVALTFGLPSEEVQRELSELESVLREAHAADKNELFYDVG